MRSLFALALLLTSLAAPAAEYPPHGVVLMYHRFGENQYPSTNVRLEQFEAQLDYLEREKFHIWPLRRLVRALFDGEPLPDRTIALSVDDAYLSVYRHAYPIVRERKLPLTVFVSTDAVDQEVRGYLSWQQMREMQAHGIDFANHSASHDHLAERRNGESAEAWRRRVKEDIARTQRRLEQELGADDLPLFAYPFGEFSAALGMLVREMGYIGFGQHSGAIGRLSGRHALPRFPINERYSALDTFAVKASSLPLPLSGKPPMEPLLGSENPPPLTLQLAPGEEAPVGRINCFLGNGTPLKVVERGDDRITVQAATALGPGRNRYNCTAAAGEGRYYWFSQPWQNGPDATDPAR
jgi:peptidoglycan/xylan/chitin deacetylase (PgdA/CDA1 family)